MKTELDKKIVDVFSGCVVRKDLIKEIKGNAIVPTYVLEYLLGQYCPTDDETTIDEGIDTIRTILREHYVHRSEAELVKSRIKESRRHKVIDMISVSLNDKDDVYEAKFANLGISKVLVAPDSIKKHPKLLVNGVWCIATLAYTPSEDKQVSPWILESIKPIQLSYFDLENYTEKRSEFSTAEWIDLLIQSMGFNPDELGWRNKIFQLMRLVPYCERNYNLIELGPKGTGKSHIYSEFSPHGILLSGGEVTVPKLFVNNSNGRLGLVGYWDAIAFDEFAGKQKKPDKSLVDIMKNYMANKSFSRGVDMLSAEASMVFVGNTAHTVEYMLSHSDLFEELPSAYHDSAFLDRLHYYIPGWEVDIIRGEMFSSGFGFVVDYLAEILRAMRDMDFSNGYKQFYTLSSQISTRDRDAINKTMSGLMKLIYPNGAAPVEEVKTILEFAMEGRKRVKDQLMRFDYTFDPIDFHFLDSSGQKTEIKTLEERNFPQYYYQKTSGNCQDETTTAAIDKTVVSETQQSSESIAQQTKSAINQPPSGHIAIAENQIGISYEKLFQPYLRGAKKIVITDPYLRQYHQIRNLLDLMMIIIRDKSPEPIEVCVLTSSDEFNEEDQKKWLGMIADSCAMADVTFRWEFADAGTIHARHIVTDTGWKILLDRGLDIFQRFSTGDGFSLQCHLQQYRPCKAFEVTYMKLE